MSSFAQSSLDYLHLPAFLLFTMMTKAASESWGALVSIFAAVENSSIGDIVCLSLLIMMGKISCKNIQILAIFQLL